MNRDSLDRWCEWVIFGCVLIILILGPLAFGAVEAMPFIIIQLLTGCVLLVWLVRLWSSPRARLLWPPICWVVVAFCGYALVRYLQADIEYVARQEIIRVFVYGFLLIAILNNLHRQELSRAITFTLIFLAMAISCYAIYQFLANSNRVWDALKPYAHRGSGTFISPNHLGGFLEMILPLALAYTIVGRVKPVTRIFIGYAAAVIVAGIAVTLSRGSWISTVLSLFVFFTILLFHRTHRLPAVIALVLMVGAGIYFLPRSQFLKARSRVVQDGRVDDGTRFQLWLPALELWRGHPWWGIGPGHFDHRFRQVRPQTVQRQPYRVHNDFINTLVDWGVAGTALIATAVALLAWGIIKTWRFVRGTPRDLGQSKLSNKYALLLGSSIGLLAIFFHSAVDFNMHIPANAILAITLMALVSGHLRFATEGFWFTIPPWAKALFSVVFMAAFAFFSQQAWRRGGETFWLDCADRAQDFSSTQIAALERAFMIEPKNADTAFQIGKDLRRQSQEGGQSYEDETGQNYEQRAQQAMFWFERSMKLDPWNAYSFLGYGSCLDWLGRTAESWPYFSKAEELDPNGYFTIAQIGLHYVEAGKFAAARPWFERSLLLEAKGNRIARNYLQIANDRLLQEATNEFNLRLSVPAQ